MKRLAKYFFSGLIFLVPIGVTAYIIWKVVTVIDGWLGLGTPGLGVLVVIAAVTITGFLVRLFVVAPLVRVLERLLSRLPFVKMLYRAIRDLLSAVVGDERRFDQPVLVRVSDGISVIGFVTRSSLEDLNLPGRAAVYLPQSYNFAGQTLVVDAERIEPLEVPSAELMTFVVSAGVSGAPAEASADETK